MIATRCILLRAQATQYWESILWRFQGVVHRSSRYPKKIHLESMYTSCVYNYYWGCVSMSGLLTSTALLNLRTSNHAFACSLHPFRCTVVLLTVQPKKKKLFFLPILDKSETVQLYSSPICLLGLASKQFYLQHYKARMLSVARAVFSGNSCYQKDNAR